MKQLILKNGIKIEITNEEAKKLVNFIMNNTVSTCCTLNKDDALIKFFKLDEIVAII